MDGSRSGRGAGARLGVVLPVFILLVLIVPVVPALGSHPVNSSASHQARTAAQVGSILDALPQAAAMSPFVIYTLDLCTNHLYSGNSLPLDCGGFNPSAVAYDGGKGAVFVANYGSNSVSVISDATNTVVTTIPVGTRPYGVAYDSGKGEVFVSNQLSNNVSVISDATNTVVATIPVGTHPLGIAYDSRKGEVFVINSNSNNVSVVSDMNNAVVTTIPVGFNPLDVAYDSGKGEVFVTNANSNNVSVISDATDTVVATVAVGSGPAGLAFDASNGYVYLSNTAQGTLSTLSANAPPTDYPVTFTESGLPAGTDWSVTLAGTTNSSMTPTIGFREPNGTYSFTVRSVAGGYTATPSTGSLNVSAASVSEAVTFSSSNGSSSSGFLGLPGNTGYYLLGGVAILVAAGAAVALVLRVRRK